MKKRLVIIDGNSLVNRAFYALPKLTNSEGLYTNAILGFTKMLQKIIQDFSPDYLSVAFDVKAPTFRHLDYTEYKGTRKGMPEELAVQMPVLKELLDAFEVSRIELPGFEADDLLGTVTQLAKEKGIESIIVSGDKDTLQLVNNYIKVAITKKGISEIKLYDDKDVYEDIGVLPCQVVDYKGLSGDSSDNIPGVRGIGAKTAAKLISEFGTVESIYENIDKISSKRTQMLLNENRENAFISKKLATIIKDIPLDLDLESLKFKEINKEKSLELITKLEMNSVLKDLGISENASRSEKLSEYQIVKEYNTEDLLKKIIEKKELIFKTLSIKQSLITYEIVMIGILLDKSIYIVEDLNFLKSAFEDETIDKIGFTLKEDYLILKSMGIELSGLKEDLLIGHYLLYPDRTSTDIEKLSLHLLNVEMESLDTLTKKGKISLNDLEKSVLENYLKNVLILIDATREQIKSQMTANGLMDLYADVEIPLIEVLGHMEFIGFKVDLDVLGEIDNKVSKRIIELETLIYQYAMEEFNINSPKQLGTILFEKLGLKSMKKTKTGFSTNHDVLMKLIDAHPIVDLVIEYRTYSKLKSTYIDGLKLVMDEKTNRVHTSFNQTVAVTGRLSSTEPNMQNIPIRLDLGRELRKIFVASDKNYKLVDADYSQIELRILAHLSQDENLMLAYKENIDIHTLTASQVFDIPLDAVTSKERGEAKGVNFGIVYGISDYGLSENLGISRKKAKLYIENYFKKYARVKEYLDELIADCKNNGYVETIMGRKRAIPEINSSNFNRRNFAERTAMNTPIQGSAADIIKIAMIKVYQELKERNLKSKLILQVHDELIIDTCKDELEIVKEIVKRNMENAIELSVPLLVDMNVGDNWYETK
ncbi:MAG: DNA polymerase I [Clostridiales bacterium]|nr:DNA polymerase I [Clostridiales bacterium]